METTITRKECKLCKITKLIDQFYKNNWYKKDGYEKAIELKVQEYLHVV